MAVFRKGAGPHELSVAMTGVRLGDRLLQIGCANAGMLAAVASKVGLSGRACVLAGDEATAARAARGAAKAGVLVEIERTTGARAPYTDESFDLVVVDNTGSLLGALSDSDRSGWLREAWRLLGPRGRLVAVDAGAPSGLTRLFKPAAPRTDYVASGGTPAALRSAGFRAVRVLAERDGLVFIEATK